MATIRKITDGPSKFDLMNALFDGKEVIFTIEGLGQLVVRVKGIRCEDGSNQRWLLEGWLPGAKLPGTFTGYFNTKYRTGHVDSSGAFPDSGLKKVIDQFVGK